MCSVVGTIHIHVHINVCHLVAVHHLRGVTKGSTVYLSWHDQAWRCVRQLGELFGILRVRIARGDGMGGLVRHTERAVGRQSATAEAGRERESLGCWGCAEGKGLQAFLWYVHVSTKVVEGRMPNWVGCRTFRCSVKPSVPPMATSPSPSSSRPRFLDDAPQFWVNMAASVQQWVWA